MNNCRHIFINELAYSHPYKIGRQVVMRKCIKCEYREIKTRLIGTVTVKKKTLVKK